MEQIQSSPSLVTPTNPISSPSSRRDTSAEHVVLSPRKVTIKWIMTWLARLIASLRKNSKRSFRRIVAVVEHPERNNFRRTINISVRINGSDFHRSGVVLLDTGTVQNLICVRFVREQLEIPIEYFEEPIDVFDTVLGERVRAIARIELRWTILEDKRFDPMYNVSEFLVTEADIPADLILGSSTLSEHCRLVPVGAPSVWPPQKGLPQNEVDARLLHRDQKVKEDVAARKKYKEDKKLRDLSASLSPKEGPSESCSAKSHITCS